ETNVKPSFVAMATLTQVLDGATLVKAHDTGSASLYALEFSRRDGQRALAYWTLRGSRTLTVQHTGPPWRQVDDQGNGTEEDVPLLASTAPKYLLGKGRVEAVHAG